VRLQPPQHHGKRRAVLIGGARPQRADGCPALRAAINHHLGHLRIGLPGPLSFKTILVPAEHRRCAPTPEMETDDVIAPDPRWALDL
jgi:hypothetical protein